MRAFLAGLALALLGTGASAETFERCEKSEIETVTQAILGAAELAEAAAAAVRDDETYRRWFGTYSPRAAEVVRTNLKAVHAAILARQIHTYCGNPEEDGCKDGTYAYVYSDEPFTVTLCPPFFSMPAMFDHDPDSQEMENGTQEGTIIHELTHFDIIAGTDDICYSRPVCSDLAREDPAGVRRNADTYQYFAEDVAFFPPSARVPVRTGRMRP